MKLTHLWLILMISAPAFASAENVEFEAPSGATPQLHVALHWGSIEVLTHDEGYATIEARGESNVEGLRALDEPRLEIEVENGRISVRQPEPERGSFRSAQIEVRVPARCNLELVMLRGGDIEVRGVEGEFSVTNLNGSVDLRDVAGAALVNASNGAIQASFREVDDELDLQFVTLNGSVELCLPASFEARLALFTEGDPILSDFDVQPTTATPASAPAVEQRGRASVFGQIGGRERWLVASTLNGEIRLEQCP